MKPSTAPGPDDGVSPRQSSCVVESQAHAESQQHVSPCQSSRVVVSQAHAGAAGTRPSPAESPGVAVSTPNHADQHLPGEGRDRSPGCANPVGLQAQDVEGAVRQFITAVRKAIPAAVSEAPATRHRANRVCLTQKMAFRAVVLGCQRRATACQQARGAGIERPHSQMAGNGGRHVSGC
jgi:hypothetical protein